MIDVRLSSNRPAALPREELVPTDSSRLSIGRGSRAVNPLLRSFLGEPPRSHARAVE